MRFFTLIALSFVLSIPVYAQQADSVFIGQERISSRFRVAIGGDAGYQTPQKYGIGAGIFIGSYTREVIMYDSTIARNYYSFRGLNPHASLYRGGYKFGLFYYDFDSYIGPVGFKAGPVYYMNNSYSSVMKRRDMVGVEVELIVMFRLTAGILKEVDGNRFIPTLGFGFQVGPNMYKDN